MQAKAIQVKHVTIKRRLGFQNPLPCFKSYQLGRKKQAHATISNQPLVREHLSGRKREALESDIPSKFPVKRHLFIQGDCDDYLKVAEVVKQPHQSQ